MQNIQLFFRLGLCTLITLSISACANFKTEPFYYKSGQLANIANCSGPSWINCYELASKTCQASGYEILEKSSNRVSGFLSSTDLKEIIYLCNKKQDSAS